MSNPLNRQPVTAEEKRAAKRVDDAIFAWRYDSITFGKDSKQAKRSWALWDARSETYIRVMLKGGKADPPTFPELPEAEGSITL